MGSHIIPTKDTSGAIIQRTDSVKANVTPDGKIMYGAIHGQAQSIDIGQSYKFRFQIPYTEILFFGAELYHTSDNLLKANFTVRHPANDAVIEQYGHDVNIPKNYVRQSDYAARLPQGLILECEVFNTSGAVVSVGVNFLMHELRSPV